MRAPIAVFICREGSKKINRGKREKRQEYIGTDIQKWEVINNRKNPSTRPLLKENRHFIFRNSLQERKTQDTRKR
jgi:hypothetical protein